MLQHFHIYLLNKRRYFFTGSYVRECCQLFRRKFVCFSETFTYPVESSVIDVYVQ